MQDKAERIVILGTGGTIAGKAADAADNVGYKAGQVGVDQLVLAAPPLAAFKLETEQVAQLDSKDMDFATWQRLAQAVDRHLQRDDVRGVVITHGTDTLEETAYLLMRVLAPRKPVVLTAAMRPSTALQADGPQNLLDAVAVASQAASGVFAVLAGRIHGATRLRKVHSYAIDAFASVEGGALGTVEEGRVRWLSQAEAELPPLGLSRIARDASQWPWVEIVQNHAGADGRVVEAMLAHGVHGIVVAGTGNGTLSNGLTAALQKARDRGVSVLRSTRCDAGPVIGGELPSAGALSPVKARIELLLQLLA
ncbi:asparaginase [Pelomonas sp. SE-A7]|nr:asparaginase [Pelomonas sp. SE-A7]MDM4765019.1 asparaginase [Pelomonas sp. SE-A7]